MADLNKNVKLVQRPVAMPTAACWALAEDPIPSPEAGQALVAIKHISLDPAQRAWMNEDCYVGCVALNSTMWAFAVGEVMNSLHPGFKTGDLVRGIMGVQQYSVMHGDDLELLDVKDEALSEHLGLYGMTGLTAYFGVTDLVDIKPGDQVLISTSAGAVGSIAAQIAKLKGAYVVGIAGGPEKVDFCVNEIGLDGCIDYKNHDFETRLAELMPDGVDIYFDNVGVPILDYVLKQINEEATIIICGAINQFQNMSDVSGPSQYLRIPERKASLLGFTYFHYSDRFHEGVKQLRDWIESGQIRSHEHPIDGLENFHDSFMKLFNGKHIGKLIINP
jgi:NADPH-dependent curcumin reductase CurA